jgi:hypothetical protein
MSVPSFPPEERLLGWLLNLLGLPSDAWSASQRSFLTSLLGRPEGTRILGRLAATTVRLRNTGMSPAQMGDLAEIYTAQEKFWKNPSPETYKELGIARW